MHAPPACDGTSPPASQPAAKRLAVRPPLHTLDPEELIWWAREYACVEEKGLASVVRACREAGLDGAALCGVPNVDALRDVYMLSESVATTPAACGPRAVRGEVVKARPRSPCLPSQPPSAVERTPCCEAMHGRSELPN